MDELLTPAEMSEADRLAGDLNGTGTYGLMLRAGQALAGEILQRYADAPGIDILCGTGNNGGDGYVLATLLREHGWDVHLWCEAEPEEGIDAARAAAECQVERAPLDAFVTQPGRVVVDALFGAGLSRPVDGVYAQALQQCVDHGARIVAVDLPSGVSGVSGAVLGLAAQAELTVTFFRKKPGHVLYPGRGLCGEIVVADIGIPEQVLRTIEPRCRENLPSVWLDHFPQPSYHSHKYRRGHVGVFSGPATMTGAARLTAMAAARIGAGAVTMLSPANALAVNAMHLTSIMLRRVEAEEELATFLEERHPAALVLGPGFGIGEKARLFTDLVLRHEGAGGERLKMVLDADALTSFVQAPQMLFDAVEVNGGNVVMTPHEGEFERLFPDIAREPSLSKAQRARFAAERSACVVLLKGADTVIASPDGRLAINTNATPYLATAGSGDVLAGMVAGLMGQGMPCFEAACAAVYLHAETGRSIGPGLIAEDLPARLPVVLNTILRD
jgi:hydroxyethylthiazole kinase-like uncharacterized protein yjeF